MNINSKENYDVRTILHYQQLVCAVRRFDNTRAIDKRAYILAINTKYDCSSKEMEDIYRAVRSALNPNFGRADLRKNPALIICHDKGGSKHFLTHNENPHLHALLIPAVPPGKDDQLDDEVIAAIESLSFVKDVDCSRYNQGNRTLADCMSYNGKLAHQSDDMSRAGMDGDMKIFPRDFENLRSHKSDSGISKQKFNVLEERFEASLRRCAEDPFQFFSEAYFHRFPCELERVKRVNDWNKDTICGYGN